MKIEILNPFRDKETGNIVDAGDIIESDEVKRESLSKACIKFREVKEPLDLDDLKSDDLKKLCEKFDIEYTNVKDAREKLKDLI